MRSPWSLLAFLAFLPSVLADTLQPRSAKRGLVFVQSTDHPNDDLIWIDNDSDLTWYYNYGPSPSAVYANDPSFSFVPMLWGAPSSTSDTTFLTTVTNLTQNGVNITYVMSFNEPDGTTSTGGSDVTPALAASTWIRELEPLRKLGITLGAPAVTSATSGFTWLVDFFTACNGGCTADFIPVHWYGDFQGLASYLGQVMTTYPNMTVWVTEFALENGNLTDSQSFFNESCEYYDRLDNVTHYSYFGAFRSDVSNVGPNVAMLTSDGSLTDIGSWYLGGNATGNIPQAANTSAIAGAGSTPTPTYHMPALVTAAAGKFEITTDWRLVLGLTGLLALL